MSTSPHEPFAMVVGIAVDFVDGNGERWRVTERDCRGIPGARAARCLIFMSESVFRRVWNYPVEWRTLSEAALAEVSWQR